MGGRAHIAVIATGCAALAGCGSSSGHSAHSSAAPTHSHRAAAATNGEAAKPAGQIVSDAARAVRAARSYRLQGTIRTDGQTARLSLTFDSPTALDFAFSQGDKAFEIIDLPAASYLRANDAFWRAHAGSRVEHLSGHWLALPPSATRSLTAAVDRFAPATLARCLVEDHGTLQRAGTRTVAGQPSVAVKDAGNAPGSSPGELDVAATGAPYPLRLIGTGRQRPGGRIDVCNDGKASDTRGALAFSDFGNAPPIQAPAAPATAGQTQGV